MRTSLALAALILGCQGPSPDLLDFCDGADDDGDGRIDEGAGPSVGCADGQVCESGACVEVCGDGTCVPGEESCAGCPSDCGACPSCGDGACNGVEGCTDCPGDCGACPSCGDGRCNGVEGCTDCPDDCGRCPGECQPCTTACPAPLECGRRICDGALGCFGEDTLCPRIGTADCNDSYAWAPCTTDADCPTLLECTAYLTGGNRCLARRGNGDSLTCPSTFSCPPAPSSPAGLRVECVAFPSEGPGLRDYDCYLRCTSSCPYGMTCSSGTCRDAES